MNNTHTKQLEECIFVVSVFSLAAFGDDVRAVFISNPIFFLFVSIFLLSCFIKVSLCAFCLIRVLWYWPLAVDCLLLHRVCLCASFPTRWTHSFFTSCLLFLFSGCWRLTHTCYFITLTGEMLLTSALTFMRLTMIWRCVCFTLGCSRWESSSTLVSVSKFSVKVLHSTFTPDFL